MQESDNKWRAAPYALVPRLIILGFIGACGASVTEEPQPVSGINEPIEDESCGEKGSLSAILVGGIDTHIEWSGDQMSCESMQRPNGEGIRLRFRGDVMGEQLTLIIAMPELKPGQSAGEVPSNVTATVEGSGRFFSTPDLAACWTELSSQELLADEIDRYSMEGALYCVAPLGELNGDAAVSIPELHFSGIVKWSAK